MASDQQRHQSQEKQLNFTERYLLDRHMAMILRGDTGADWLHYTVTELHLLYLSGKR